MPPVQNVENRNGLTGFVKKTGWVVNTYNSLLVELSANMHHGIVPCFLTNEASAGCSGKWIFAYGLFVNIIGHLVRKHHHNRYNMVLFHRPPIGVIIN